MQNVIRLLPDTLANQIAAGEVVQRPASVVKELLENAVDAGSSLIKLVIKNSGKTLIQVTDDGVGMTAADARMCFERHATSKITAVDDLFDIQTKGFRGEAMASIAAVAQVELKTSTGKDNELGICLLIEGSKLIAQKSIQTPKGTTVIAKNLFFNVPARRNFLKSDSVELRHIYDEFHRVALAHPDIEFAFYHNDNEVYQLKKGKLAQRIVSIFGKNYKERLIPCHEQVSQIKVEGYIGKPTFAKKTRGEQFFMVNNRFIKHTYFNHAVTSAYQGMIPEGAFPFYVLCIQIDPKSIDINVHPTKTEVKFEDERTAYAVIQAAVKQALGTHHLRPSLDFDYDVNYTTEKLSKINTSHFDAMRSTAPKPSKLDVSNLEHWEQLYEESIPSITDNFSGHLHQSQENNTLIFESAVNNSQRDADTNATNPEIKEKTTFQVHYQYIVSRVKSGILLINQQAAHQRILYERFMNQLKSKVGSSQQLLFPKTISFNPKDIVLLSDLHTELQSLGFIYKINEKDLILEGIPADLLQDDPNLLEEVLEQYKINQLNVAIPKHEHVALSMAQKGAVRQGVIMNQMEMQLLINQLFACESPNYTPDGSKTFIILDEDKVAHLFL